MLRKRIEVVTKKVLKLLCNFAVPLRASLMILVSWSSGWNSISKLVCVTTANLLILSYLTKFLNTCFRSLRLLFPFILRIVVYGCLTGVQVPVRGAIYDVTYYKWIYKLKINEVLLHKTYTRKPTPQPDILFFEHESNEWNECEWIVRNERTNVTNKTNMASLLQADSSLSL